MRQLRPYQKDAVDASWQTWTGGAEKALMVLASGLGKTVIAAEFARKWILDDEGPRPRGRILFMMHKTEGLLQAREEFRRAFGSLPVTMGMHTGFEKNGFDSPVLFATFQSMRHAQKDLSRDRFGLIMVDEAHHGQAPSYKQIIEYFRPRFRLGFTATPNRMDGLDIRDIFGNEVYSYALLDALQEDKWLARVDYRLMNSNISRTEIAKLLKMVREGKDGITIGDLDRRFFLKEKLDAEIRAARREQSKGDKQCIVFCRSKAHADEVYKRYPGAELYYSGLSKKEERRRFEEFRKGKIRTLVTVDKFLEAVDIPNAELVIFLRLTNSRTVWEQQFGRGLRKVPQKDTVVVLDFVANCRRLKELYRFTGKGSAEEGEDSLTVKTGWRFNISKELVDVLEVLELLEGEQRWEIRFAELQAFKEKYGHCNVPQNWPEDKRLAKWASYQRQFYKIGKLIPERIKRLEEIGFEWDFRASTWEYYFTKLQAFKEKYGHCNVPWNWPENRKLATWTLVQRRSYKTGKLIPERIKRLEEIGFEWDPLATTWKSNFSKLQAFKNKYGHCNVPYDWPKNRKLANWTSYQRQLYKAGKLKPERIKLLEGIGFEWRVRK